MREMKNKNPSFHIEKEGFYVQVMHPYINEVPHSIFQAIKLAGSGTVFKMNLLPRFQRASPSTSLDTMSKRINFINFVFL